MSLIDCMLALVLVALGAVGGAGLTLQSQRGYQDYRRQSVIWNIGSQLAIEELSSLTGQSQRFYDALGVPVNGDGSFEVRITAINSSPFVAVTCDIVERESGHLLKRVERLFWEDV